MLARDLVGGARPDVVGAKQVECLGALVLGDPVQAGEDLLGRFLAGIDDVLRLLETFIEGRVVEHAVILLEHRQHRLAGGRGPAAHHRSAFVLHEKLLRLLGEGRPIAGAVFLNELDLAAEHAALGVDLLDGELFGLDRAGLADRHRAGDRMQDTDRHFGVGDCEAGRVHLRGRRHVRARQIWHHRRCRQRRRPHEQPTARGREKISSDLFRRHATPQFSSG